jgi:hypothetical protein
MPPVFELIGRLPRPARLALGAAGIVAAVALGVLSAGPPRLTLVNAAIAIDYPWLRGASALGAALGVALFGATLPRAGWRLVVLVAALLPLGVGLHLLLSRVEASAAGLTSRGLFGTTTLAWNEIAGVSYMASSVIVQGGSATIDIDTTDFSSDQRATLERTIARRVKEGGGAGRILTVPQ